MVTRLLKKKAETQINKTGEIPADISEEIARTVYGYTHVSARVTCAVETRRTNFIIAYFV